MSSLQNAAMQIRAALSSPNASSEFMCHIADELKKYEDITKKEHSAFMKAVKYELQSFKVYDKTGEYSYSYGVITNVWAAQRKYNLWIDSQKEDRVAARIQWLTEIIDGKISYDL
jgi:hypothetical protein